MPAAEPDRADGSTAADAAQVLEFALGEETYCVSIDYVTEIVDVGEVTPVPNAPRHVEGVMDLRGWTTSIVNPKTVFGLDGSGEAERIIVFDASITADGTAAGWLVDAVHQVVDVDPEAVDTAPAADDAIRGLRKRGEDFVIWVDPKTVHGDA